MEADQAFGAVARVLSTLASRGPLVALLEDLHWAVPTLLELLGYCGYEGSSTHVAHCLAYEIRIRFLSWECSSTAP